MQKSNKTNKYILERLKPEFEKLITAADLELFDVVLRSEQGGKILRVTIDSEEGAGIEDCTNVSRIISEYLDSDENLVPFGRYNLEVSTPGMERPLRCAKDFERFKGKKCKIVTIEKDSSGRANYTGRIEGVSDSAVELFVEKENSTFNIGLDNISKANLVVEF